MRLPILLAAIAIAGCVTLAHAQPQPVEPPKAKPEMLDHWRRATVSLGKIETKDGVDFYKTLGSAVIVAVDPHHGCLLTAKHMVLEESKNWKPSELRMRLAWSSERQSPQLGVKVALINGNQNVWKSVEDSDLAVIPFSAISREEQEKLTDVHAISINEFASTEEDIFQGAPVLVLGYPGLIGESRLSTPIARSGIIAWTDPSDALGRPFIIDANIFPGNSGGPAFHVLTGSTRSGDFAVGGGLVLIGIVSATSLHQYRFALPSNPQDIFHLNPSFAEFEVAGLGGIGIIEPVSKAKALVQQFCGP
jgi:hypothetical protein